MPREIRLQLLAVIVCLTSGCQALFDKINPEEFHWIKKELTQDICGTDLACHEAAQDAVQQGESIAKAAQVSYEKGQVGGYDREVQQVENLMEVAKDSALKGYVGTFDKIKIAKGLNDIRKWNKDVEVIASVENSVEYYMAKLDKAAPKILAQDTRVAQNLSE